MQGYITYMVVTNSYTAGNNQLHDSSTSLQQELARNYILQQKYFHTSNWMGKLMRLSVATDI